VTVVATCRSDEVPLAAHVAGWLAQVRGVAGVEEIRLGPLSRAEVERQVAGQRHRAIGTGETPAAMPFRPAQRDIQGGSNARTRGYGRSVLSRRAASR
jgi:hypothetical protein